MWISCVAIDPHVLVMDYDNCNNYHTVVILGFQRWVACQGGVSSTFNSLLLVTFIASEWCCDQTCSSIHAYVCCRFHHFVTESKGIVTKRVMAPDIIHYKCPEDFIYPFLLSTWMHLKSNLASSAA